MEEGAFARLEPILASALTLAPLNRPRQRRGPRASLPSRSRALLSPLDGMHEVDRYPLEPRWSTEPRASRHLSCMRVKGIYCVTQISCAVLASLEQLSLVVHPWVLRSAEVWDYRSQRRSRTKVEPLSSSEVPQHCPRAARFLLALTTEMNVLRPTDQIGSFVPV